MKNEEPHNTGLLPILLNLAKGVIAIASLLLLYQAFGDPMLATWRANQPTTPQENYTRPVLLVDEEEKIENGIHIATGLIAAEGFKLVRSNCTSCHSAKLVTQNRATREGWAQMIDWMQEKQGLWDLREKEPIILDYLAKHYAPEQMGRRSNIDPEEVEWYILELE